MSGHNSGLVPNLQVPGGRDREREGGRDGEERREREREGWRGERDFDLTLNDIICNDAFMGCTPLQEE